MRGRPLLPELDRNVPRGWCARSTSRMEDHLDRQEQVWVHLRLRARRVVWRLGVHCGTATHEEGLRPTLRKCLLHKGPCSCVSRREAGRTRRAPTRSASGGPALPVAGTSSAATIASRSRLSHTVTARIYVCVLFAEIAHLLVRHDERFCEIRSGEPHTPQAHAATGTLRDRPWSNTQLVPGIDFLSNTLLDTRYG